MDGLFKGHHEGDRGPPPMMHWQHRNPLSVGMVWKEPIASTADGHITIDWMAMQLFVIEAIISSRSLRSLVAARWPLVWSALASLHA
jgi:hypothetical protein